MAPPLCLPGRLQSLPIADKTCDKIPKWQRQGLTNVSLGSAWVNCKDVISQAGMPTFWVAQLIICLGEHNEKQWTRMSGEGGEERPEKNIKS